MCDRYILIQPIKGQLISVDIAFWVHEELIILIQIQRKFEFTMQIIIKNTFFYTSSLLSQPLAPYQEAECVGLQIFLNSFGYFNKCLLLTCATQSKILWKTPLYVTFFEQSCLPDLELSVYFDERQALELFILQLFWQHDFIVLSPSDSYIKGV